MNMSEQANARHENNPEICFGIMYADEKGRTEIPPKYSYKVSFKDDECLVIPLEENKAKKKGQAKKNNDEITH